jgi:hypothetical protein
MAFLDAADYHGLGTEDVRALLEASRGNPDKAWEIWAANAD